MANKLPFINVHNRLYNGFKFAINNPYRMYTTVKKYIKPINKTSNIKSSKNKKLFGTIKKHIIENVRSNKILDLKTQDGNTQNTERDSISIIRNCLDNLNMTYNEAGSQQSKDFRNINNSDLNIEIKKTDNYKVFFNDTLPSEDIYYIIFYTGKIYKSKKNINPQIIFINGIDLIGDDIDMALEYKKDIEYLKDKWARKKKNINANNFKYLSVFPRPTYKTDIRHLLDTDISYQLN